MLHFVYVKKLCLEVVNLWSVFSVKQHDNIVNKKEKIHKVIDEETFHARDWLKA